MKTKLLFLSLLCLTVSVQDVAQSRSLRADTPFVIYRVDEQQIPEADLDQVTDGKIEAFHNREKIFTYLKEGKLTDSFSSMGYDGLFTVENGFSVQDRKQNFARGEVTCSGIDTFKSFVGYVVDPSQKTKEELYKCLLFSKASYLSEEGSYFLEGGLSFPVLTKETTLTFIPKEGILPDFNQNASIVKNISFHLNQDVHKMDVSYQFSEGKTVRFSYDFIESYLPVFLENPFAFLKNGLFSKEVEHFNLTSFSLPTIEGKTGLSFAGRLNSKEGMLDNSKLTLFSEQGQNVAEISYLNGSFFMDIKYPQTMTPIIEGEFKNLNSKSLYNQGISFFSSILNNPSRLISPEEKANFLSGLEIKNLTVYDMKHNKKALIQLKFDENITEKMLKEGLKDPKLMDLWVTGEIILFDMPTGQMTISFYGTDEVSVNGKSGQGVGAADLYGILKLLQKQMKESTNTYLSEMEPVLSNVFVLGPITKKMLMAKKIKNVFDTAQKIASKNYAYCAGELEREKIDFMYDCAGVSPNLLTGIEIPDGIEISLPNPDLYSLIFNDPKLGGDVVYLTLKFQDQEFCKEIAKEKKVVCKEGEITTKFIPNALSY